MPFCPGCHYEYKAGIKECPDCQLSLVEELPKDEPPKDIEWAPLHGLPGTVYAEMVKEVLEKADIQCMLKQDPVSGALGLKSASLVGSEARIFVPKDKKDQAEKILDEMLDHI